MEKEQNGSKKAAVVHAMWDDIHFEQGCVLFRRAERVRRGHELWKCAWAVCTLDGDFSISGALTLRHVETGVYLGVYAKCMEHVEVEKKLRTLQAAGTGVCSRYAEDTEFLKALGRVVRNIQQELETVSPDTFQAVTKP